MIILEIRSLSHERERIVRIVSIAHNYPQDIHYWGSLYLKLAQAQGTCAK